ncbi:MAG: energy-coupling factor transporter ATPase [Lachnospiraceae bacterium]|nr:energy-coupling factor transporter ATPase [Lachnospiraceae bacterium]
MLELENVSFTYDNGAGVGTRALEGVSFSVEPGEFIGLIGHTGSGKSTLLQLLIGLLKPTEGRILFEGEDIGQKGYDLKKLRSRVGMVFQYPEHQLFEETVFKDVCYGPQNIGLSQKECELRAYEALRSVGLPDECFYVSPFELSGGQKRRVAIAGILAMKPDILVLDEPTAGLDPAGKNEILDLTDELKRDRNISIILVSHCMEDVAEYADRILVMDHGRLKYDESPVVVFSHVEELEKMGLSAPAVTYIMRKLKDRGVDVRNNIITIPEAGAEIMAAFKRRHP